MMVIVSYDVSTGTKAGRRRLRRVARICENYGQRIQFSVFQCLVDPDQWVACKASLFKEYDPEEDSLRFFFLGRNWRNRMAHHGIKTVLDLQEPLIV
jgi:CRISPR-associated protein Cas2